MIPLAYRILGTIHTLFCFKRVLISSGRGNHLFRFLFDVAVRIWVLGMATWIKNLVAIYYRGWFYLWVLYDSSTVDSWDFPRRFRVDRYNKGMHVVLGYAQRLVFDGESWQPDRAFSSSLLVLRLCSLLVYVECFELFPRIFCISHRYSALSKYIYCNLSWQITAWLSQLFDASLSIYSWLSSLGCLPCSRHCKTSISSF